MGNLFGVRRKPPQVSKQDLAILQLKQQRDKIRMYQKRTELELDKSKETALKLFQNDMKERALIVMKRRKCMQDIIHRTDKQLETLEQLVSEIEFTQAEVSVIQGLKIGNEALKQLTSLMNVEDIQQMLEDTQEAAEKQKEITDLLSGSAERFDDSELLQELDNLIDKTAQDTTTVQGIIDTKIEEIPSVPETIPSVSDKQTEPAAEDKKVNTDERKEDEDALLVPA